MISRRPQSEERPGGARGGEGLTLGCPAWSWPAARCGCTQRASPGAIGWPKSGVEARVGARRTSWVRDLALGRLGGGAEGASSREWQPAPRHRDESWRSGASGRGVGRPLAPVLASHRRTTHPASVVPPRGPELGDRARQRPDLRQPPVSCRARVTADGFKVVLGVVEEHPRRARSRPRLKHPPSAHTPSATFSPLVLAVTEGISTRAYYQRNTTTAEQGHVNRPN